MWKMHFSASYKMDMDALQSLVGDLPFIGYRLLNWVSYEAKQIFLREFVSGQELQYRKAGIKRTRYGNVRNRRNVFRVTSLPMNLFERNGKMWKGKYILTKKLPDRTRTQVGSIIEQFKTEVLTEYVD